MKALLFAAAISVSGIALAQGTAAQDTTTAQPTASPDATTTSTQTNQDTTATQTPTNEDTSTTATQPTTQPSGQTVDDPSQAAGPQGVTQQGTDPNGQATTPAGTNMPPSTAPASGQAAFTPQPAAGTYPPCSRTVTDSCVQTYERGVRRSRRR